MNQTYDLTTGKITPIILKFFFPMFFTNMLQQIYTIADTVIVGQGLGDNALAAVGNMSSLSFLIVGFSVGLANGFAVPIAQYYGAKNYHMLRKSIASAVILSAFVSIILTTISMLTLRNILILLQTDSLILHDSLTYGYIVFAGLITTMSYNLCACILRALGDSKTPFIAIIISTLINIILNCFSIFVLGTGVEGVAIATICAQIISTLICLTKLSRVDIIRLTKADFETDFKITSELFGNGLPMALMNSITAIGCMVVQYFVNGLGVAYTSAYSVCSKYINLFMQPACTAGYTMSSFTSQNYGAQQYDRIKSGLFVCLGIALTAYILLGGIMVLIPKTLAGLMLEGETSIELASQFLPICGIMIWGVDFLFIFRSGVQGMGKPLIPMISGIIEMVMRISVIVLFIERYEFRATALAEVVAWLGALTLNFIAFQIYLRHALRGETTAKVMRKQSIHLFDKPVLLERIERGLTTLFFKKRKYQ